MPWAWHRSPKSPSSRTRIFSLGYLRIVAGDGCPKPPLHQRWCPLLRDARSASYSPGIDSCGSPDPLCRSRFSIVYTAATANWPKGIPRPHCSLGVSHQRIFAGPARRLTKCGSRTTASSAAVRPHFSQGGDGAAHYTMPSWRPIAPAAPSTERLPPPAPPRPPAPVA